MSAKKRILRTGCITILVLAFVGYFAFTSFFFAPHEGKLKYDVTGLVPSDVDLFVARANLGETFAPFPDLAIAPRLESNRAVQTFLNSRTYAELDAKHRIQANLETVRAELGKLPFGIELLDVIAGDDVAVAAEFPDDGSKTPVGELPWAAYARASFTGKLGAALLRFPGLIGLDGQGIEASQDGDITTLTGGQLKAPIHVTRILDVVVAGTSKRLVQQAQTLYVDEGEGSLLQSATYNDDILAVPGHDFGSSDFELKLDVRSLRESLGWTDPWPDPKSDRIAPAIIARMLPVSAVRQLTGVVDFDQGLHMDLTGKLSSELMTDVQSQLFRSKGFDQRELRDVAGLAPEDTTMMIYMRGPIGTIARQVLESIEPAMRDNLEAMVRRAKFPSLDDLVNRLDNSLIDRIAFFVRPNDYPYVEGNDPPNDGKKVFAWMVMAWMSDREEISTMRDMFGNAGSRIGLQGRTPGAPGFFSNTVSGDLKLYEFWSMLVPGTGHIATMNYGEILLISNQFQLVDDAARLAVKRNSGLAGDYLFTSTLEKGLGSANVAVYLNPSTGTDLLVGQARAGAELRLQNSIDYRMERPKAERRVLAESFGGKPRSGLNADEDLRFKQLVDEEMVNLRDRIVEENLPRELKSIDDLATYLNGIARSLTLIDFDERSFKISSDTLTPYGGE